MKKLTTLLFLTLFFSLVAPQDMPTQPLIIQHVNVIDATGAPIKPNMTVVISGSRIVAVRVDDETVPTASAHVVDATGKYLIPGLWDAHVHVVRNELDVKCRDIFFSLFLANGITSLRDVGSNWDTLRVWRKDIGLGAILGPRIISSGPILAGPGSKRSYLIPVPDESAARQAVDSLRNQGVDFIKLLETGDLSREVFLAIADQSNKVGLPFVGHTPLTVSPTECSMVGMSCIEHLTGLLWGCSTQEASLTWRDTKEILETYDDHKARELFSLFATNGTWQCPTLVLFDMKRLLGGGFTYFGKPNPAESWTMKYFPSAWDEYWQGTLSRMVQRNYMFDNSTRDGALWNDCFHRKQLEIVKMMLDAGVEFLAGTDCPAAPYVLPGFSLHDELALFVEAGFTPMEALQTATHNPAKFFGILDSLGTVEQGKIADLVLLDANPLDDVRNTQKINAVVVNGRFFGREELDGMLTRAETTAAIILHN